MYKGRLADGSLVAVKRLKEERTPGGELQFQTEVEMISMAVHRNLLRLRGFCMTPTERLLVYPYMANGSVASCLRGRSLFIQYVYIRAQHKLSVRINYIIVILCLYSPRASSTSRTTRLANKEKNSFGISKGSFIFA